MNIKSLRIINDATNLELSLESITVGEIQSLFRNIFPSLVNGLTGFVDQFSHEDQTFQISSKEAKFIAEVNKYKYMDLAPLTAYVPEGLDVPFSKYSTELMIATTHASRILAGPLTAFSTFLAELVSNSDAQLSTKSFVAPYKELERERNEMNEGLGKCFKHGSTITERTYGDVISRNSDWPAVFHNSDAIVKMISSVDRNVLNKKVKECTDLLNILMGKIERDELKNISAEAVRNLANGAFQVASELEFYSVTYYKALAYSTSLNRTVEHFMTAMDRS